MTKAIGFQVLDFLQVCPIPTRSAVHHNEQKSNSERTLARISCQAFAVLFSMLLQVLFDR